MTSSQSYLARIAMGSALIAIGTLDFRAAAQAQAENQSLLASLDSFLFSQLSDETLVWLRRGTALLLVLVGAGICLSSFFSD